MLLFMDALGMIWAENDGARNGDERLRATVEGSCRFEKRARGVRKQHYAPMPQQDAIVQMAKRGDPDFVFSKALRVLRTQAQTAAA